MIQTSTSTNAINSRSESNKQEERIPTLWDTLSADDGSFAKLFPPLPDNYFDKQPDTVFQKQPSKLKQLLDKYESLPVKPFVRQKNLNEGDESAPEKNILEIGLSFDF